MSELVLSARILSIRRKLGEKFLDEFEERGEGGS